MAEPVHPSAPWVRHCDSCGAPAGTVPGSGAGETCLCPSCEKRADSEHPKTHRFNVNFSEGAYRDLTALAERQGKTLSQVLRDAIALEVWFQKVRDEGCKVLVERPDGRFQEVIPR